MASCVVRTGVAGAVLRDSFFRREPALEVSVKPRLAQWCVVSAAVGGLAGVVHRVALHWSVASLAVFYQLVVLPMEVVNAADGWAVADP